MSTILTAADAFVLATADDEMQDRWIPDEEGVRHIRSKEYLKPCMVKNLNFGISRRLEASSSEDRSDRCSLRSTAKDTAEKNADKCL